MSTVLNDGNVIGATSDSKPSPPPLTAQDITREIAMPAKYKQVTAGKGFSNSGESKVKNTGSLAPQGTKGKIATVRLCAPGVE